MNNKIKIIIAVILFFVSGIFAFSLYNNINLNNELIDIKNINNNLMINLNDMQNQFSSTDSKQINPENNPGMNFTFLKLGNPRFRWFNDSGYEVWGLDHYGSAIFTGNVSANKGFYGQSYNWTIGTTTLTYASFNGMTFNLTDNVLKWLYNQTSASGSTYNATYDKWAYNQSVWNVSGTNLFPKSLGYKLNLGTLISDALLTLGGSSPYISFNSTYDNSSYLVGNSNGDFFIKRGNTIQNFRISSDNVGILTSTPAYTLDVRGNMSINSTFYVVTNSKVGIGTSTPSAKLEVAGNLNVSTGGNITIGRGSIAWNSTKGALQISVN